MEPLWWRTTDQDVELLAMYRRHYSHQGYADGRLVFQCLGPGLKDITPACDEHTKLARYEHGGGRLYRETPPDRPSLLARSDRTLIADFYHEGDREFYAAAPRLVRELLDAILRDRPSGRRQEGQEQEERRYANGHAE